MDPSRVIGPSTEWREWIWEFRLWPCSVQGSGGSHQVKQIHPPPSFKSLACRRKPKTRDIMQEKLTSFSLCDVLFSCNKSSPTEWLKTTWMYCLTVLEGRSLGNELWCCLPYGGSRGESNICLFQLSRVLTSWDLPIAPHHSYLCFLLSQYFLWLWLLHPQ